MEDIANDIVDKFKNDPSPDFKAFIVEVVQPVMYMLKRQQSLKDFFDTLKVGVIESMNKPFVSQRLLIDTIMMNSNRFLGQHLISLLSKRNSVPMIQPSTDLTKNKYRAIPSIIHIWDYERPILLSFGIGQCKGKSTLINAVFSSNFEESMEDLYFCETVDIDFGFHFNQRRPINIADAHGEISIDTLNEISILFNGFLIHVECKYLCSNQANVIKYLTSLPCQGYIWLLIRDSKTDNDPKLKSSVDTIRSACSHSQIVHLTDVTNKSSLQNKSQIKRLRESIFSNAAQLRCFDKTLIQEHLEKLLDSTEKEIIKQNKIFINNIRDVLITGKIEDYPLYSSFMNRFINTNDQCVSFVIVPTFISNVQKICKFLIDASSAIIRETGDSFCIPTNWINFANRVFQTIKKHPNLTYFQDVFERNQYKAIREDIRQDFDQYLSPAIARLLVEREKQNSRDHIRDSFEAERNRTLGILEEKLNEHCNKHEATDSIRDRSLQLMKVQLINIFRSWEVSTVMKSERLKYNQMVIEIDKNLREKATTSSVTHKNHLMDRVVARKMFEEPFDNLLAENSKDKFKSELVWKQCITLVSHLCDVLITDDLPSMDNLLGYVPFLTSLDPVTDQPISTHECLSKIHTECASRASNLELLASRSTDPSRIISIKDIEQTYIFLNGDKLSKLFLELQGQGKQTRATVIKGLRQQFSEVFQKNWETIVRKSSCFEMLTTDLEKCLTSEKGDEFSTEIKFVQEILGVANKIIQNFSNELSIFGFCLSKQFCSSLYIFTVISAALYYYNEQKTDFLNVIKDIQENRLRLVEKYIPWVVLVENDDESVAMNFINELSVVLYSQSFEPQAKTIFENCRDNGTKIILRSSIIKELDDEVVNTTDDWLTNYILHPQNLIIERFKEKWEMVKKETNEELNKIVEQVSRRLNETFQFINAMNTVLAGQGGHLLTFVDELFKPKDDQNKCSSSDKKFCMAKLFYNYLIGEQVPTEITVRTGSVYTIDSSWKKLVDQFPQINEEIKQIFRSTEHMFETAAITYPGLFLDKISSQRIEIESKIKNKTQLFIDKNYLGIRGFIEKQVKGCGESCPCCKRICDVDHHLDVTSPVGSGENRHSCQFGHQIRAMGGMRYEINSEASMAWCEIIKDEDAVNTDNKRESWETFKEANNKWDFGDPKKRGTLETRYVSIWKRIGRKLCVHFGNGMTFVEKNTPLPISHFILVLDHSGSMNERNGIPSEKTPWEHLLQAVEAFLKVRKRQIAFADHITVIVFGNRAERIYNLEKLKNIDVERLNIPNEICGGGTYYSAAFQMVIKTLEEVNSRQERDRFRQALIFMTDGEPLDNSTAELQKLCDWRKGS
ncbi:unnamed protein product [Rotaria sp. Silwood2]|nr:unnamed protein product [Rotaria sp. Silwood2]CAF4325417.1 unnamed protein product [Rotaria sp. Silwood2]